MLAHVCVSGGPEVDVECLPCLFSILLLLFFFETCFEPGAHCFGLESLASKPQELLISASQLWDQRCVSLYPTLYVGSGDLNSGPHSFMERILQMKPSH